MSSTIGTPELNFEALLNAEQLAAATAPDGPILVLAAAGTGKTRTLVFRVAHLVQRGTDPERILLLTFTNKAAREMLARAHALVPGGVSGLWGGTFHHMANRILRRYANRVGFDSDYTILDRDDSKTLVGQCAKDLKVKRDDFPAPAVLMSLFSAAANIDAPLEQIIQTRYSDIVIDVDEIEIVRKAYEQRKQKLGAMDFDDLLVKCLALFRQNDDVSGRYCEQFAHILVDEYQDTNPIQAELVDRLAVRHRNLLVVGDDFQSIYSWRGADYRNIMSFPQRYEGAQTYMLETNYRSVPEILEMANACIAGNPEQFQKVLRPTREAYHKPGVVRLRDGEEQARYVTDLILRLRREGIPLSEIAVLYRAHFHALDLERCLPRAHVPYVIVSGIRFFEQAHIKDVCSLLRLMQSKTDELAFSRLLRLLPGVGERTVAKLWQMLGNTFDIRSASQRKLVSKGLRPASRDRWEQIAALAPPGKEDVDGEEIIRGFVEVFYKDHLIKSYENFDRRLEDVAALAEDVTKFESVEGFLSDVALLTNVDAAGDGAETEPEESVRLSTVHQAKGLEWSAVIILWATEGMFPSSRALQDSPDGDAEERRLFYVAITRAKDELFVCVPEVRRMRDGGVMYCEPSRFVDEIPSNYVKTHSVGFI
jgi:DNA helicase-2/ATP-dependent DNA helicase PcrA